MAGRPRFFVKAGEPLVILTREPNIVTPNVIMHHEMGPIAGTRNMCVPARVEDINSPFSDGSVDPPPRARFHIAEIRGR